MNKKVTLFISILLFAVSSAFAGLAANNVWFENVGKIFRDLGQSYTLSDWSGDDGYLGLVGGYYLTSKHEITVTIESDYRFTSMSDPEKYREYQIRVDHKYGDLKSDGGVEKQYTVFENQLYSATRPFSYTFKDSNSKSSTVDFKYWFDLSIIMGSPTTAEKQHMSSKDDYVTTIKVTTKCNKCNDARHNQTYIYTYAGYYNTSETPDDITVFADISENVNAHNINLVGLMNNYTRTNPLGVADIHFTTSAIKDKSKYAWNNYLVIFASSNRDETVAGERFSFRQAYGDKQINYSVTIKEEGSSTIYEYGGTGNYTKATNAAATVNRKIDLKDYVFAQENPGGSGASYYFSYVDFDGTIGIYIPTTDAFDNTGGAYSGAYTSNIYIHICNTGNK